MSLKLRKPIEERSQNRSRCSGAVLPDWLPTSGSQSESLVRENPRRKLMSNRPKDRPCASRADRNLGSAGGCRKACSWCENRSLKSETPSPGSAGGGNGRHATRNPPACEQLPVAGNVFQRRTEKREEWRPWRTILELFCCCLPEITGDKGVSRHPHGEPQCSSSIRSSRC
jgi:hypothetical protein